MEFFFFFFGRFKTKEFAACWMGLGKNVLPLLKHLSKCWDSNLVLHLIGQFNL